MQIKRAGRVKKVLDVYDFLVVPSSEGSTIHVYLDKFYRLCGGKILHDAPRWGMNDPQFSTLDTVDVPEDVIEEVLDTIRTNITLHLPEGNQSDDDS